MVSLLIALAETKAMAGAMRKLPAPIPAWAPGWPPVDIRAAFLSGYAGDVWRLRSLASLPPGSDTFAAIGSSKPSLLGRILTTAFAPFVRHCVTNVVEIERECLHRLEARADCAPESILPPDTELLPEWNVAGKSFIMTNAWDSSWRRLNLALAHLEGTRLIVAAKAARARDGKWPAEALPVSDPCPASAWSYATDGAGGICFRTLRHLEPVWKGETLLLPLEYCER
jgi:hypothetical protein